MRSIYLLIVLFFSSSAFSQDYYWQISYDPPLVGSSPLEVCTQVLNAGPNSDGTFDSAFYHTETRFKCYFTSPTYNGGLPFSVVSVYRYGDSCPVGSTYNSENGLCEFPPVCLGKVRMDDTVSEGSCDFNTVIECMKVGFSFNECVGDVGGGIAGLDTLDPAVITPNLPTPSCVGDGNGNEVCFAENPPDKQCGMVNGSMVCLDRNDNKCRTASLMTGGKKTVCPKGTPPPTGTGETHTLETTTINTVNTVGAVTTTNTYNTSVSTSSSGPNGSGSPDPSKTPKEQADDEKANGSVSGGGSCDVAPVCKGDIFQCEIIRQQFLSRCPSNKFIVPTLGDNSQKLLDIKAEFDTEWQRIKSEVESQFSTSLSSGGSIPTHISSVFGVDIDFSISRFLPYLQIIAGLIVAMAWVIAAGIVMTGKG